MKILFIGGTGTISMAITRALADTCNELYLLNRGNRTNGLPLASNIHTIEADINDEDAVKRQIEGMQFDSVCDFIAFVPEQAIYVHKLSFSVCEATQGLCDYRGHEPS